jgi:sulfur carrier protein
LALAKSSWHAAATSGSRSLVHVRLSPQGRELQVTGLRRVCDLLEHLKLLPGTVLVIRGDRLLTEDAALHDDDEVELRAVVSGGQ